MKKQHLLLLFCTFTLGTLSGQGIFDANIHTAIAIGDVSSPFAEMVQNAIDQNPGTKFLDFEFQDGLGFDVDLGEQRTATRISITTANDMPNRDPMVFQVWGANDGGDFEFIDAGEIPCVQERFLTRNFVFENETAYSAYRIVLTDLCGDAQMTQIADVQLYETVGQAPQIDCPEVVTLTNDPGQCGAIPDFEVVATDAEDGSINPVLNAGIAAGELFPIGATPVVYTATDSDANRISCNFTVTITDGEAPVFDCPDNLIVDVAAGQTEAVVDYAVTASDNCSLVNTLEGYTPLINIDNNVYFVSEEAISPLAAYSEVILDFDFEAFVATIRSADDNAAILDAVTRIAGPDFYLIGFSDDNTEGQFQWFSGEPVTYTNWNEGEPNNQGVLGPENFTVMLVDGTWNDVDNEGFDFRYLLERPYQLLQTEGLPSGSAFPLGTTSNSFVALDNAGNTTDCTFTITVGEPNSVADVRLADHTYLVPNPTTNGELMLVNKDEQAIDQLRVQDLTGKVVYEQQGPFSKGQHRIELPANLAAGVYLVELIQEGTRAVKKLVVA